MNKLGKPEDGEIREEKKELEEGGTSGESGGVQVPGRAQQQHSLLFEQPRPAPLPPLIRSQPLLTPLPASLNAERAIERTRRGTGRNAWASWRRRNFLRIVKRRSRLSRELLFLV